ncbi:MAG: cytochrome C oxidase subunit IV family protein [Deltaproteobacteria bacterium]|nr:cytochrome C oxidase subunit IV family protein [Deltaproteobacteria bacterium]
MAESSHREGEASHRYSGLLYSGVFAALMVLAAVTWGLSQVHLGRWNLVVALAIAGVKASLVVLFFMHLWTHRGGSRLAVAVCLTFVAVLVALTIADMGTRLPVALPPESGPARQYMERPEWPASQQPNLEPGRQEHFRGP